MQTIHHMELAQLVQDDANSTPMIQTSSSNSLLVSENVRQRNGSIEVKGVSDMLSATFSLSSRSLDEPDEDSDSSSVVYRGGSKDAVEQSTSPQAEENDQTEQAGQAEQVNQSGQPTEADQKDQPVEAKDTVEDDTPSLSTDFSEDFTVRFKQLPPVEENVREKSKGVSMGKRIKNALNRMLEEDGDDEKKKKKKKEKKPQMTVKNNENSSTPDLNGSNTDTPGATGETMVPKKGKWEIDTRTENVRDLQIGVMAPVKRMLNSFKPTQKNHPVKEEGEGSVTEAEVTVVEKGEDPTAAQSGTS